MKYLETLSIHKDQVELTPHPHSVAGALPPNLWPLLYVDPCPGLLGPLRSPCTLPPHPSASAPP